MAVSQACCVFVGSAGFFKYAADFEIDPEHLIFILEASDQACVDAKRRLQSTFPSLNAEVVNLAVAGPSGTAVWFHYNDARLDGTIHLERWNNLYPNARLLSQLECQVFSLEDAIRSCHGSLELGTQPSSFERNGLLCISQGDPLSIFQVSHDILNLFDRVSLGHCCAVELPGHADAIEQELAKAGFCHSQEQHRTWVRDPILTELSDVRRDRAVLQDQLAAFDQEVVLLKERSDHLSAQTDTLQVLVSELERSKAELSKQLDLASSRLADSEKVEQQLAVTDSIINTLIELTDEHRDLLESPESFAAESDSESEARSRSSHPLEAKLRTVSSRVEIALTKLRDHEALTSSLCEEKDQFLRDLASLQTSFTALQDSNHQLSFQLTHNSESHASELRIHHEQSAQLQAELASHRELKHVSDAERAELLARLELTCQDRDSLRLRLEELGNSLKAVEGHRDQLTTAHDYLAGLRDLHITQIEELSSEIIALKSTELQVSEHYEHSLDELKLQLASRLEERNALDEQLQLALSDKAHLLQRTGHLQTECDGLLGEQMELRSMHDSLVASYERFKAASEEAARCSADEIGQLTSRLEATTQDLSARAAADAAALARFTDLEHELSQTQHHRDQLSHAHDVLTDLRDSLSAQNEELRAENLDLANRLAELESDHAAKTCELLALQDELGDRLNSSLSKLSSVEQHLAITAAELTAFKNLEATWNSERQQFQDASHSASMTIQDLSTKLDHAEASLCLINSEHEEQIKALEHELVQTRSSLADEIQKTSELTTSTLDFEPRLASQTEELSAAHLRLEELQSELAKVSKHRDQLSAAHDFLVGLRDSITQQNEELRSKVDSLEHVKSELESNLRHITEEVAESAQRNAELAKLNIDLQGLVDNSEQHLAFLKDLFIQISTSSVVRAEPTASVTGRSD